MFHGFLPQSAACAFSDTAFYPARIGEDFAPAALALQLAGPICLQRDCAARRNVNCF